MNILFFDVDGPMVPGRALFLPQNIRPRYGWQFDPAAVGFLNFLKWLVPDLQVVIASHRNGMRSPWDGTWTDTKASWERIFKENGLELPIHDDWITPRDDDNPEEAKIVQISKWLARHPKDVTFCTIEDEAAGYNDKVTPAQRKYLNLCGEDYLNGITWQDMEKIIMHFGRTERLADLLDKYRMQLAMPGKNVQVVNTRRVNRVAHREPA